jgi:hypothetical protein
MREEAGSAINQEPVTFLLSMRPLSHETPAYVHVTLHGLHDLKGNKIGRKRALAQKRQAAKKKSRTSRPLLAQR